MLKSRKESIDVIADYVCLRIIDSGSSINVAKLQKLLYLVQAWYMVNNNIALFDEDFEAWSHGPACRAVYDRFNRRIPAATPILKKYIDEKCKDKLDDGVKQHINNVLDDFSDLSFIKLEEFFHEHDLAFKKAREGLTPSMKSDNVISKEDILDFFKNHYQGIY